MANRKEARVHKEGDYVLATRWPSGDVDDAWAIGVYNGSTESSCPLFPVVHHVLYRHPEGDVREGTFRRVKKISDERGEFLVRNKDQIQQSFRSWWWWVRCNMKKEEVICEMRKKYQKDKST